MPPPLSSANSPVDVSPERSIGGYPALGKSPSTAPTIHEGPGGLAMNAGIPAPVHQRHDELGS